VLTPKRIAIVGTRPPTGNSDTCSPEVYGCIELDVCRVLEALLRKHGERLVIVSGGAEGVDTMGEDFARANNLSRLIWRPRYKTGEWPPKAAPMIRNEWIVRDADCVIAWPSPRGGGTANAIGHAKRLGKPLQVRRPWHEDPAMRVESFNVGVAATRPGCPEAGCGAPQFRCSGGVSCENGHGLPAEDVEGAAALPWRDG